MQRTCATNPAASTLNSPMCSRSCDTRDAFERQKSSRYVHSSASWCCDIRTHTQAVCFRMCGVVALLLRIADQVRHTHRSNEFNSLGHIFKLLQQNGQRASGDTPAHKNNKRQWEAQHQRATNVGIAARGSNTPCRRGSTTCAAYFASPITERRNTSSCKSGGCTD